MLLSSDNEYLINAINDNLYPITYQKNKTKEQTLNSSNFANIDVRAFDSKIGFITNLASNFIAMSYNFKEDSDEHKELIKRVNLLRYFQGVCMIFVHLYRNV